MIKGYFDNAATSYVKPEGMYDYIANYMSSYGANVGRGAYQTSIISGKIVSDTRANILSIMNAQANRNVVFTPSATIALNTILFGLELNDGDVVYVSHFEHNAVLRPLYAIQKKIRIKIVFLPMREKSKYSYDLEHISLLFSKEKPKVVIVSHVSNVIGLISPVESIMSMAKTFGAITIVDGAQACGLIDCDLTFVDFYVFAGHKTLLGPTGIGGFICNRSLKLSPLIYGGTGIDSANHDMPINIPDRFEAGTTNLMSIVGLNYSTKWILNNIDLVRKNEKKNLDLLFDILSRYTFLRIINVGEKISSIISCRVDGYTSDEFGNILSAEGISVRTGLHCAPLAHEHIGSFPEGLIRFSISCFTSNEDFNMLDNVLKKLSTELV